MLTREQLIKRDKGICGLCKTPVDLAAKTPHPNAATIGHIIPVSRGGNNDDGNLRLEHWNCNHRKSGYLDRELDPKTLRAPNPVLDPSIYLEASRKQREGGKIGGIIGGATCARNKVGVCGRSPEKMTADGKKAGKAGGPLGGKNVHISHPGMAAENGRKIPHDLKVKGGKLGALNQPREAKVRAAKNIPHEARIKGCHNRWHKARGIVSPHCIFCQQNLEVR